VPIHSSDKSKVQKPEGFEERTLTVFFQDRLVNVKLLLPDSPAIDKLVRSRCQAAADAAREFDEQLAAQRKTAALIAKLDAEAAKEDCSAPVPSITQSRHKKFGELDPARERDGLAKRFQADLALKGQRIEWAQVYAWDEPCKLIDDAGIKTPDREWRERDQALFKRLSGAGPFRRLGSHQAGLENLGIELLELRHAQPHFAAVIDMILGQIRLAEVKGGPLRLSPILLAGPSGVGKTHFTLELARAMGRPVRRHSMDVSHTASTLMGFDMVCLGDQADPLILLDELDKARRYDRDDPLAPLHSLLEPVTATRVTDISAGIEFDASHILWIATANELNQIPEPIRSRFRVFNISMPSAEESIALARAVGQSVHDRMNTGTTTTDPDEEGDATTTPVFLPPDSRIFCLLAHLTPREQIQALEHAYATALVNGRLQVLRQDLPADVLMDDGGDAERTGRLH
jgi:ATP-dependent Lon protease